jgi:hypothetical protein
MAQADQGTLAADDMPVQAPVAPPVEETAPEAPRVYAGSYKDPDELEKGYGSLKSKFDSQGNELGQTRAELQKLQSQLLESQKPAAPVEQPTDFKGMQSELAADYENGDMSFAEYAKQSNALTAQTVQQIAQKQTSDILSQAESKFSQTLQERDEQAAVKQFHDQYPDFAGMQESGALNELRQANPMFDDVTAYFALTAQNAREAGRAEQASIEAGSDKAGKVIADPGTAMQQQKRPTTEAEIKASMAASLNN